MPGVGGALLLAGTGHLTTQRQEFPAQVPDWLPADEDTVVVVSGVVELLLGAGADPHRSAASPARRAGRRRLLRRGVPRQRPRSRARAPVPSASTPTPGFALLLFQPLLVAWALWSTGGRTRCATSLALTITMMAASARAFSPAH